MGIRPLQNLVKTASRSVFISYKWCDGVKRKARDFAFALARNGFMPWLDSLAFPGVGYSSELKSDPDRLEKLLGYGYERCKAVVAMGTAHYGRASGNGSNKNWTEREWAGELWEKHRPHRIVYPHQGHKKSALLKTAGEQMILKSEDPDEAAGELREWFDTMDIP